MSKTAHKPRSARQADKDLGQRIRARRIESKMSQADLGAALGVSFQQVQKYEKGVNRVAAATLGKIAVTLDTTVTDLMGTPDNLPRSLVSVGMDFLTTHEGAKIAGAWPLFSELQRGAIAAFVVRMAGAQPMQPAE
jgi:transcriptional regulator with XRE-family HTH domain